MPICCLIYIHHNQNTVYEIFTLNVYVANRVAWQWTETVVKMIFPIYFLCNPYNLRSLRNSSNSDNHYRLFVKLFYWTSPIYGFLIWIKLHSRKVHSPPSVVLVCDLVPVSPNPVITYPFPNFNGKTVEVWEWISNFIPHFVVDVITLILLKVC